MRILRLRTILLLILLLLLSFGLVWATLQLLQNLVLRDFASTFYPAGQYLARGENVYRSDYTYSYDGTQHPPYNPIWILYAAVPLSVLPLDLAESLRFLIDLATIPFLAYLCYRWGQLRHKSSAVLLAFAPWFSIMLYSGQWAGLALLGTLLCYYGIKRASSWMTAIGLWLALARVNFTIPIILATLIYVWQNRTWFLTIATLLGFAFLFSLQQPLWMLDLFGLYVDRFIHPRPADSILLLPAWPWAQFALLAVGILFLFFYVLRIHPNQPSRWLWAILICVGLVSALHEYTYDWIILMLPLAWLLQHPRTVLFVIIAYVYTFVWAFVKVAASAEMPHPAIIPSMIMIAVAVWPRISPTFPRGNSSV